MANRLPMTPARRAILGAGIPVALAVLAVGTFAWVHGAVKALAQTNRVGYRVALTAPLTGGQADVTAHNADTVLTADTGLAAGRGAGRGGAIRVRGYLSGSMARPVFGHQQTAAGLTLNPWCRVPVGSCSLSLAVTVPAGVPVRASDSFGNLRAGSLRGTVSLSGNSADLVVSRLAGQLRLADAYGNIQASALSGSIAMANNSGDITAAGVTGDTRLTDAFGNITISGLAAGDVRCQNQSGDITLTFSKVPRRVDVSDSFGNITVRLPPGPARYWVSTRNPFGHTSVTVPQSRSASHVITATDNSGDITIAS
jgi:hypothetical protein